MYLAGCRRERGRRGSRTIAPGLLLAESTGAPQLGLTECQVPNVARGVLEEEGEEGGKLHERRTNGVRMNVTGMEK